MCEEDILKAFTIPLPAEMEKIQGESGEISGNQTKCPPCSYPAPMVSYRPAVAAVPAALSLSNPPKEEKIPTFPAFPKPIPLKLPTFLPSVSISKANSPLLRPFECSICSLPFSLIDEALFHMLRMHCTALHECPHCPVTSKDFSGLRIHVDLAHKGEKAAGGRGTEECLWCQSQANHTKHCLVTKYNSGREGNRL